MTASFTIINASYVATAVNANQYPAGELAEIAFIGRSNVGKSSLINSLCRRNGLARTSGTPGKTQTINYFRLAGKLADDSRLEFMLVDLPGYGYAKRAQTARSTWSKFIEEYWLKSSRLKLVCQLIDLRHPPMESDMNVYRWLIEHGLEVQVVATKADKISKSRIRQHIQVIYKDIDMSNLNPAGSILAYSAVSGLGRDELLDVIRNILLK
ncbi:ribosome biogenesis GTP-binding protein YihA/YsxC [Sporomusa acidovorans]|uniref:Probable GTP-binding protein EngB n=1 Tax=Sporomusa acidovorans (strain ATCC 49682 / DSM 3132 / Mol) TaxID=1123286 RepID=A0ABZ3J0J4_SPOA4|nr:ribosome biogenesis GTP-binding protein YihA/YsxC [Sporomusa acidovorans]OZC14453.1 putative GTP-binding protein EngB [Sporomusa acidovorans DSM 3132]SDF50018.1 GTP-binding protein [Sporomusa acidovorans]